jgi:AcrR family transcriptional regulator
MPKARRREEGNPPLSRARILEAAMQMADEGGLEALTMRKLASVLGVEAMSIYYYVASRDALVSAMLESVHDQMEIAGSGPDWKAALRSSAMSAHHLLEQHPWASNMIESPARMAGRMRYMNAMLACLRRAGFSLAQTDLAYHTLDAHIVGGALWGVGIRQIASEFAPESDGDGVAGLAGWFRDSLSGGEFPYLVEHVDFHMSPEAAQQDTFEFGLEVILDALERLPRAGERLAESQ